MKSMRIALSLLMILTMIGNPLAFAGPKGDARVVVANSQEAAKDKARIIFHDYLQQAALQAANVLGYADNFNGMTASLSQQMGDLEKFRFKLAKEMNKVDAPTDSNNIDRVATQLSAIYQTVSEIYSAARAAEKQRDYLILKNGSVAAQIRNSLSAFFENLNETCEIGIPANFEYPELPSVRPILPSYSFGINLGVDSGGNFNGSFQVPSAQTSRMNGDTAAAVYTTAYAGGFVLGAYLVTGQVVMTSTAAAALTASQTLAATGVGAAVAAVVALVVYFDGLFGAISQSREVSDALWIVFNEKADAETVRAEFKNICKPFVERIGTIQERITAVNKNDQQAIEQLKVDRQQVQDSNQQLMGLQSALDEKMIQIRKDLDADVQFSDPNAKEAESMKRLSESDAARNMLKFVQNSKSEFLMKIFEVALIDIGIHIDKVDQAMQEQYKSLFKNQTEQHLEKIVKLAEMGRRMAIPKGIRELVHEEIQANKRISKLFRQFDSAFANYVQMELTLGQSDRFKIELSKWLKEVKAAHKDLPNSATLKVLMTRGASFLVFLEIK